MESSMWVLPHQRIGPGPFGSCLLSLSILAGLASCAGKAPDSIVSQPSTVVNASQPLLPVQIDSAHAEPACPSQVFDEFLQAYADAEDDSVRRRYTTSPLEYVVPTHTLRDDSGDLSAFTATPLDSEDRWRYFGYRYIKSIDDYRDVGVDLAKVPRALIGPHGDYKYPVRISLEPDGSREVRFGMEYEVDIFLFERRDGCWFLSRATNPRD